MKREHGKLLRLYVNEQKHLNNKSLHHAIVDIAKELELVGVTIFKGIEGFGRHGHLHSTHILELAESLPILIEIADTTPKIDLLLSKLDDVLTTGCAVIIDDVEIVTFQSQD